MDDVITFGGQFYILAESSLADEQTHTLKHGDTFAIFDRHGDIRPRGIENHGVYHGGTRFLSQFSLSIEGKAPLLLNSSVKHDNDLLSVNLTNPDFRTADGRTIRRGCVFINRTMFLYAGTCYEQLRLVNYGCADVSMSVVIRFGADFRDIFEVRGMTREKRGLQRDPVVSDSGVVLAYEGLDRAVRRTHVRFQSPPDMIEPHSARYTFELAAQEHATCNLSVVCESPDGTVHAKTFESAKEEWFASTELKHEQTCVVTSTNEAFNEWLRQSQADLFMMLTDTPQGLYPFAGIPWFSTVFGRDGIIAAMHTLWINPDIARGVLAYLAAHQAADVIPEQDAEPGKILHEQRRGEMAALGEIPFGNYYGSIDSTPLFVLLAGLYYERTADLDFVQSIWPNIERALAWIDDHGDADGDGFVEYERQTKSGLAHQGWKDSEDPVCLADGSEPEPPIALCEVQAYVFEAKVRAAQIADALEMSDVATRLRHEAGALRKNFQAQFWCENLGLYAIAIDGLKRRCDTRTSNAGQCLISGIASHAHAKRIAEELFTPAFFSGWGVRTLAEGEPRYNPMSYHNGSVWPHDNAMIAAGLARFGHKAEALRILTGLFGAARFIDQFRLPELFCGFPRRGGEGPTLYPVACHPQTWASTSVYYILQACLGLTIRAPERQVVFHKPVLPPFLRNVTIHNLRLDDGSVDLNLARYKFDVGIDVARKIRSGWDVIVIK